MGGFKLFTFDMSKLIADFEVLPKVTQRAAVNALNVVGRKANSAVIKNIKRKYNVGSKSFSIDRKRIILTTASTSKLTFKIFVRDKGRGLFLFGAQEIGFGISATVIKGTRTFVKHGFIEQWRPDTGQFSMISSKFIKKGKHANRLIGRIDKRTGRAYTTHARIWVQSANQATMYGSNANFKLIEKVIGELFEETLNQKYLEQFEKKRR